MNFLRKRENLVQAIPLMAVFSAVNAIFSLTSSFLPLFGVAMGVILPVCSVLVGLTIKKRYYPIYAVASLLVSFACSAWNFQNTIFYLLPAIVFGLSYALLIQSDIPESISLAILSLIETGLFYLSILFLKLIWNIDIESFLISLLGAGGNENASLIFPLFCLAYSMAQSALTHLFILLNISKLGIKISDKKIEFLEPIICFAFIAISTITAFFSIKTTYFLFGLASLFALFPLFESKRWLRKSFLIPIIVLLFIAIVLGALISGHVDKIYIPLTLLLHLLAIDLSIFIDALIEKKRAEK